MEASARVRVGSVSVDVEKLRLVAEIILKLSDRSMSNLTPLTAVRIHRELEGRISKVCIGHVLRVLWELGYLERTGKSSRHHYTMHKSKRKQLTLLLKQDFPTVNI